VSGETGAVQSGWTVDTLREHVAARIEDQSAFFNQRMDDADRAIQAALHAADKAAVKAEVASEKRFEGVNEFRSALADQQRTLLTRGEYDAAYGALLERVTVINDRIAALELRLTSRLDRGEGADAGAAGQRTDQRLNMSQVIAAIATLAAVISLILYVTKK
jgi:hypothetical protein